MFALTCRHASHTNCLGIANDLSFGLWHVHLRFLPANAPVDRIDIPGEPAPSLHPHPSEQELHQLLRAGPPASAATGTQCLRLSAVGTLPLAARRTTRRPGRPLSTLAFSRSVQEPQTRLTPPSRRAPPGQSRAPARLIPRAKRGPSVSMPSVSLSTPQQRTPTPEPTPAGRSGTSSWSPPDRVKPGLFPERSPRRSSANAASGRFDARPRRPTLEGQQASISRTAPPMR